MNAATLLARERPVRPRHQLIDSRLRRFAWRHREAVTGLTRRHSRLADLALSFPALLFALAVPRPRFDPEPVIERVIAGAPLGELAATADIPMWTRKLMPEAFLHAIPRLPDGELFSRQIANHFPRLPTNANHWLELVAETAFWGSEALAVWFARHAEQPDEAYAIRNWRLISLWAWHAAHPAAPPARYLQAKWSPDISPRQALQAARDWTVSVMAAAHMGETNASEPWGEPTTLDGFTFEPVFTPEQLVAAASLMRNCTRTYASGIADNSSSLWVVRKGAEMVGMVCLTAYGDDFLPKLGEISGPNNRSVGPDALLAVHRWYRTHVALRRIVPSDTGDVTPANWRRLWRDYWLSKRRIPSWLPLRHDWRAWRRLEDADREGRRRRRRRRG